MQPHTTAVKALGEIALRVNDLEAMQHFYEKIIGLEVIKRFPTAVFFRIAEGYRGHTQVLVLFDRSRETRGSTISRATPQGVSQDRSTLDHLAFGIDVSDYPSEKHRLEQHGLSVQTRVFEWVGWRSLFVTDPEGNRVEFVCFDESIRP